ncbi:hypothetical protein SCHPADRAFT_1000917 [Schizopora paradoxa]|uniref:MYND-type domain-containing protein n=1 Tax=Schizopora paradoxa TaxID=27342 RepID=A0A0H2RUM7_9AGAM|nr:hypothetical protein SCHPADRAFT_1000917 [Schizopora paradoxa]
MVSICYGMDSIPKSLRVEALAAVMPFIKLGETIEALAEAVIFAINCLKWDLQTGHSSIASDLENPILCFWNPLVRALRRRFDSRFDKNVYQNGDPEVNKTSLAIFSSFLLGIGTNVNLGPKYYSDPERMRPPIRMWLHAMADSSPGHCLVEVQECFWACFTTKGVKSSDFVEMLIEESGGNERKVAYLSVSELKGNTREKKLKATLNLQIRFNLILLLNTRKMHAAALDAGAIPAITKAVLRLRRLGEECCTASSIVLFLNLAETVLERGQTVRGITEAVESGMLKVLAESVAFASCNCLRKKDKDHMASLLKSFLAKHLVLDSVLDVIVSAMAEMRAETLAQLKRSPFAEGWGALRAATLERAVFKIMLENETREQGRVGTCDFCWRSSPDLNLKKCAGCKTTVYCSTECQRLDWKEYGHKNDCKASSTLDKRTQPPLKLNDRYFLGRLAESDIRRHISGLDIGTEADYDIPDHELYYAVNYSVEPMTLDVYNVNQLDDYDKFSPQKFEALSSGRVKVVEIKYPLGNTTGTMLHVIHDNAHRRVPVLKPASSEKEGSSTSVPEAWFRSKAVWAIPPTVRSSSEEEKEDEEEDEEVSDDEDESGTKTGNIVENDADVEDENGSGTDVSDDDDNASDEDETPDSVEDPEEDSNDSTSESDANTSVDSNSDSDDGEATSTKSSTTSVERSRDEVDAVLGYMLSACGLECDQRSYERLVGVKYSWRDLEKIVNMCQSSKSWPFESSAVNSPSIVEAP